MDIIPKVKSFGEEFGESIGSGLGEGMKQGLDARKKMKEISAQNEFIKKEFGYDMREVPEEFRDSVAEKLMGSRLKREESKYDKSQSFLEDQESLEAIEKRFGPEAAELWKSATSGGRTYLLRNLLDTEARNKKTDDILDETDSETDPGMPEEKENPALKSVEETKKGVGDRSKRFAEFTYPKLKRKPLTVAEEISLSGQREKENTPIYRELSEKIKSLEEDRDSIDLLQNLDETEQLPQGVGRFTLDPKTGELNFPAAENAETQAYYKVLQRFILRAKDFFPGRVTNFDLDNFKSSLPTLSNTVEGRRLIYTQMKLANEMNMLQDTALADVYDHYGVGNINDADARKIAKKAIAHKKKILSSRMKTLDGEIGRLKKQREYKSPAKGYVRMTNPDTGESADIDLRDVAEAKKAKWKAVKS